MNPKRPFAFAKGRLPRRLPVILASQSPRRIELMRAAGYDITVEPAAIDETPLPGEDPCALVQRLAHAKAHAVAQKHPGEETVVVAADTTVILDGRALGKPRDAADAARMLRALSGRTHQVATGVCLAKTPGAAAPTGARIAEDAFTAVTEVTFYPLSDEEIASYVATGEPMDKAGAYGIQGAGGRLLVEKINGDFYNVVGLPIAAVARRLRAFLAQPSR